MKIRYNKQHRESLIVPRKMSNNFYGRLSEKESIKRLCTMMAHIKKKRRVNEEEEQRGNIYYEWKWTWQDSSARRWQQKTGRQEKSERKMSKCRDWAGSEKKGKAKANLLFVDTITTYCKRRGARGLSFLTRESMKFTWRIIQFVLNAKGRTRA